MKNPASERLGEFVRERMSELGLSLRQTAAAAKINPGYLSQVCNNPDMPSPSPELLGKLSIPLQVSCVELLYRAGYLGVRSDEEIKKLSTFGKLFPRAAVGSIVLAGKYFADLLRLSVYSSEELYFKSLMEYLLKKNNLSWNDVLYIENPKSMDLYLYTSSLVNYSAAIYISLAKKLDFDPDEFLFLLGKIPDKFLDPKKGITVLIKKTEIFKEALKKVEEVRKYQQLQENNKINANIITEISEEWIKIFNENGDWYLYEHIRDIIKETNEWPEEPEFSKIEHNGLKFNKLKKSSNPINISFESDGSVVVLINFANISEYEKFSREITKLGDRILKARTI